MNIRTAQLSDLDQLTDILNHAIKWGKATAIREIFKPEERIEWFENHSTDLYRIFVSEEDGKITGYLSIGPYRKGRQAFRHTAEVSYFVDFNLHRKGIASRLMEVAFRHCRENEINNLIAFLMAHNQSSISFMEKMGFELWGLFPNTLTIDGNEYDHAIYGKRITLLS
jgi:phosphinothricin acetyltransferase